LRRDCIHKLARSWISLPQGAIQRALLFAAELW